MRDQALFDKIDLHLTRVLRTVSTDRSVSRAALRLGMVQPAVSAALRRLPALAVAGNWLQPPGELLRGKLFSDEVVCRVRPQRSFAIGGVSP